MGRSAWHIVIVLFLASSSRANPVEAPHHFEGDAPNQHPSPDAALSAAGSDLGIIPASIISTAKSVTPMTLDERMQRISKQFVGKSYQVDPLGEAAHPDLDPLARYDAFDCLTFVEEVLSIALAGDASHSATLRLQMRYRSETPQYSFRNHFMELQWIPNNIEKGILKDTTALYGDTVPRTRQITMDTWNRWHKTKSFKVPKAHLPTGTMSLDVLPLQAAIEAAPKIKPGSLLLVVRKDLPHKPLWISHVGLVFQLDKPILRHATRMGGGGVKDNRLLWYLNHLKTYKNWPAAGVVILEPQDFGPRLSRLEAPTLP